MPLYYFVPGLLFNCYTLTCAISGAVNTATVTGTSIVTSATAAALGEGGRMMIAVAATTATVRRRFRPALHLLSVNLLEIS